MKPRKRKYGSPLGIAALIAAIAYIIAPYDCDATWYGFIDDFFVFMSGYSFFSGSRNSNPKIQRILYLLACSFLIIAMLILIILIVAS